MRDLHIISFNIPYPPNYGGVMDVYYKIKALHQIGMRIHLHCYEYNRERAQELESICSSVQYYPRRSLYKSVFSRLPLIVHSRQSDDLLNNLLLDDFPILFEGLHTAFYLNHPELKKRRKLLRMHNIEWDYYRHLGEAERNFFVKFYYYRESQRLKKFENVIAFADVVLPISNADADYLEKIHPQVKLLPAFHPNEVVESQLGKGEFILYHGNLNVVENHKAAMYLLNKIMPHLNVSCIIAGRDPLPALKTDIAKAPAHIKLVENPSNDDLNSLLQRAHVNVLPTFQNTGIKLKLLNALYRGRFCLVNDAMVAQTGLASICEVENDLTLWVNRIHQLMQQNFKVEDFEKRSTVLNRLFSNRENALSLQRLL